jgi:hypothetical protein
MLNYKDGTVAGLLESMMYTVDIKTKKDLGDIGLSILVDVSTVAPELGVGREYIFDDSHNKVCCARLLHNCKDESIVGVANLVSIRRKDGKRLST